ncbi:sugar ABC transporter substrate-binding protein [Radiobacillus sp. PE A8.2]|uniref:sugar ABC transporter substrate-binding protein n=1 Tax=Radiobacillus sp. PE A8.2 TaxID=3380349 RepID=UPI00388DE9D6
MGNKKISFLVVLLFSFIFVLAACSSDGSNNAEGNNENQNADGNSNGDSDRSLKIWGMGAEGENLAEFVKGFEEESGIDVEVQSIPWDNAHDKVVTAVASGKGPDVIQAPMTWVPEFGAAGAFLDLTDYIGDYPNLDQSNFFEESAASTVYDDQILAVPWFASTRILYYRTDLLEEVGYPEGPKTWDDMIDAATKLTARGDDQYGLDIAQEDTNMPFIFALQQGWQYDVDKGAANFEDPKFKDMVELYHSFFEKDIAQLTEGKELMQAFSDGSKPMFFGGPWMVSTIENQAPELEGKWNIAVMPEGETKDSFMGGTQLTVFHNTDKVDEALEFLNYMAKPETQVAWYKKMNSMPAVTSAWEDPTLADDPLLDTFREQLENTQIPPMFPEYEQIAAELVKTLEQINHGGADIDQALEDYRDEVESILE